MIDGKDASTIVYSDVDHEIRELVQLINNVPGIETTGSCFGHNEMPCLIFMRAESVEAANWFMYKYFYNDPLWRMSLFITDTQICEKNWKELKLVLESRYKDYPTVNLMVDDLTRRFRDVQNDVSIKSLKEVVTK